MAVVARSGFAWPIAVIPLNNFTVERGNSALRLEPRHERPTAHRQALAPALVTSAWFGFQSLIHPGCMGALEPVQN